MGGVRKTGKHANYFSGMHCSKTGPPSTTALVDDVYWIVGPRARWTSGVGLYSWTYIRELSQRLPLRVVEIPFAPGTLWMHLHKLVVLPLQLIRKSPLAILPDESYFLLLRWPFSNAIVIVHDLRSADSELASCLKERIYLWLVRAGLGAINRARHVVVVSATTRTVLLRTGRIPPDRVTVIPNAIDISRFQPTTNPTAVKETVYRRYAIPPGKRLILHVGSDESRKNIPTLIKAVGRLRDAVFVKVGQPVVASNRRRHISLLQEHRVEHRLLDSVSQQDLVELYQAAAVVAYPSLYEGFGRPVIEAQAAHAPVVASRCGSLPEVLGDSALFLDDPEDPAELVRALNTILDDQSLRARLVAKGIANSRRFSPAAGTDSWEQLIRHCQEPLR